MRAAYISGRNAGCAGCVRLRYTRFSSQAGQLVHMRSALEPVPKPVTLDAIKKEPKLKDMALVKYGRLSVQPVTAEEWTLVCKMGGMK